MGNFFESLFRGMGKISGDPLSFPITSIQRWTGHPEAARRTRDFFRDPIGERLENAGHIQGRKDWEKAGGITAATAAAIVAAIFGGGALAGPGAGGGGGGGGSFLPGTAAAQEGAGLGGLYGGGGGFAPGTAAFQEGMGMGGLYGQGMEGAGGTGSSMLSRLLNFSSGQGPSSIPNLPFGSQQEEQGFAPSQDDQIAAFMRALLMRSLQNQPMLPYWQSATRGRM